MNFKEKFQRFMYGRYGTDEFARFTLYTALIFCVISLLIKNSLLNLLALALLLYTYFRMFSRKVYKRSSENQKYLQIKNKTVSRLHLNRLGQIRYYHFYKCPVCKQTVRVPRGKGKIKIHCPKCHHNFIKKS